jgi:hypothetical protein
MNLFKRVLSIVFVSSSLHCTSGQKLFTPEQNIFQGRFIHYPITELGADISTTRWFFVKKGFLWSETYDANFTQNVTRLSFYVAKVVDFVISTVELCIRNNSWKPLINTR